MPWKYDPTKNVQLKHYAEFRIRGAILDSLRLVDWSPRTLRRQARRLDQAIANCKAQLGRRSGAEPEIAAELKMSLKSLHLSAGRFAHISMSGVCNPIADTSGGEEVIHARPGSSRKKKVTIPSGAAVRDQTPARKAIEELLTGARTAKCSPLYHYQEPTMKQVGAVS